MITERLLRESVGASSLLAPAADRIIASARPQWFAHVAPVIESELAIGASKLGGSPDLPAGMSWPAWHNGPLGFLGQINLTSIENAAAGLPPEGLLSFFYDANTQTWGFDPSDAGSAIVVYSTGNLVRRAAPEEVVVAGGFASCSLGFSMGFGIPAFESSDFKLLGLDPAQRRAYFDLYDSIYDGVAEEGSTGTWLAGHPYLVQGDMQLECAMVTAGINAGRPAGYSDPRVPELRRQATEWRLLFQLGSESDAGMMWGDLGLLYYWVRDEDMKAGLFDRTWTILQCG